MHLDHKKSFLRYDDEHAHCDLHCNAHRMRPKINNLYSLSINTWY